MKYFCLPADFKNATIDSYYDLNQMYSGSKIIETYGQVTVGGGVFNSARKVEELNQVDFGYLKGYIEYSRNKGIDFNYTLNATCNGNIEFTNAGIKEMLSMLKKLWNAGVRNITAASPSIIDLIKESGFGFNLKISTLCSINSANKALYYKKIGAKRIVVDEDITRNFKKLKAIVDAFGDGVEIIVNDTCYNGCPFKTFHFNYTAHSSEDGAESIKDYYIGKCYQQRLGNLKNYIHLNWIRPEDIGYYNKIGINYFKIQGRQFVHSGNPVKTVETYIKENYEGDLLDLLNLFHQHNSFSPEIDNKSLDNFLDVFYKNPDFCKDNCGECSYCEDWAKKSVNYDKAAVMAEKAKDYFEKANKLSIAVQENRKNEEITDKSREEEFSF